ncbi:MAG: sulfite exporter TauE/SafE family protein [Geminicoccaceae bacterium]|nr:MAG: sulfite exporter TauE/SafE family protein [Geminicoccaceae bacterium]
MAATVLVIDVASPSFALAVAAALLAGLVRGFSGFGAAMILIPVLAALYGPRLAVPVLLLVDIVLTVPMVVGAVRRCAWGEVLPLVAGFVVALPFGVYVLLVADPTVLTRAMAVVVLLVAAAMALGLRRRSAPGRLASVATGGVSGLLGGSIGIGGPPVILFWLSGQDPAARTRANIIAFFGVTGVVALIGFLLAGIMTADVLVLTALLMPAYALGLWAGARAFGRTADGFYRRAALAIITAIGLSTLAFA